MLLAKSFKSTSFWRGCLESPLLGGARSSTCLQRWPRIRAQQHAGNTYVSLPPSQPEKWTIFALKVARNKSSLLVMQLLILDAMNNKSFPLVQTPRPTGRPLHHSSHRPTTSPLVQLADHFTTRPTGRPHYHATSVL
nr:uncharacterized protein LOC125990511 isoform X5 [Syngnathus scovelli]